MLINGSALNRAAINGSAKRGYVVTSGQAQSASATTKISYIIQSAQVNGSAAIFLQRIELLAYFASAQAQGSTAVMEETAGIVAGASSGQVQTGAATLSQGGPILTVELTSASEQVQSGNITVDTVPNYFSLSYTTQSTEALFQVVQTCASVSSQSQFAESQIEVIWQLSGGGEQIQTASASGSRGYGLVINSAQEQETDAIFTPLADAAFLSSQAQSCTMDVLFGIFLQIGTSQAQSVTSRMDGGLSLDGNSSTSQGHTSRMVWPGFGSSSQGQSARCEASRAIAVAMQSSQTQTGQGLPVNYMPAPGVTTCYVPAEGYTAWVGVAANGVIVPPELPDPVEPEQRIDATVPEYQVDAILEDFENSAAVPA